MYVNNKFRSPLPFHIVFCPIALAAPARAYVANQLAGSSYGMTSGRLVATSAAVFALIGLVFGVLALFRPDGRFGTSSGSFGAIAALAAGLIAATVGGLKAATSSGVGTGGGLAGAIVAVVLGLTAVALGGLALARSRRTV